jgi:uncharacterized protein YqfA (UPF0365 family)
MAVALEHEMLAKIQEAKAKLIQAQAEIPSALSGSLRKGQLFKGQRY